jgi:hypothetical protein
MRLRLYQVAFRTDNVGWICAKGKYRVRIIQDERHPQMFRIVRPGGGLSDMVNLTRAKDTALGLVESMEFVGINPQQETHPLPADWSPQPPVPLVMAITKCRISPLGLRRSRARDQA